MGQAQGPLPGVHGPLPAVTPRDVELFRMLLARRAAESELRGESMGATIPGGTRIRITPLEDRTVPVPGQVVAFLAGARVMVHRVVHVASGAGAGFLITRGDGNLLCDPPVALESVAGLVESQLRDGAWQPVEPAPASEWRLAIGWPLLALQRATLERSPALAMRLARVVSYARNGIGALSGGRWRG